MGGGGKAGKKERGWTYTLVVFQAILVLVCLFAAYHGAVERFRYPIGARVGHAGSLLLLADRAGELAIFTVLGVAKDACCLLGGRGLRGSLRCCCCLGDVGAGGVRVCSGSAAVDSPQSFGRFIYA